MQRNTSRGIPARWLMPMAAVLNAAVLLTTGLPGALAPSTAHAQWTPVVRTDTITIGAAGALRLGAAAGALMPVGEAFYDVGAGSALQLFLARSVEPFDEMRLGVSYSRHPDELAPSDVVVRTAFVEMLFGTGTATRRLRLGPRVAYIHQMREIFANRMHTVGFGGVASIVQHLGSRIALDASIALTGSMMPGTDLKDPLAPKDDGWSSAWLREFRIGLTARPW